MSVIEKELAEALDGLDTHPGYIGAFTRAQATGAISNGTRVVKVHFEEGDGTPRGTEGVVLGSVRHPEKGYGYFIEWDNRPKAAVLCMAIKIDTVENVKRAMRDVLDKIKVVSDEEAEKAGHVVCIRADEPTPFTDNERGICVSCGAEVQFRPSAPKTPPRICLPCVLGKLAN